MEPASVLPEPLIAWLNHPLVVSALGVVFCGLFAAAVLVLGVALRRRNVPLWLTRALVRLAAGGWVFIAFNWITVWPASWPVPVFFLILNYYARHRRWTQSLCDEDDDDPPLITAWPWLILVFLFWWPGYQFMLMAGVMAHAVGISAAMIVSRKYGRQRFRFRGSRGQTFEGLAAMAVASFAAIFYTTYSFAKIPGVWFGPWAFFGALMTAAVATVALLYTPRPHEQWSVPILASLTMYYYAKVGFHF